MTHAHNPDVDYEQPTGNLTEPDHINLRAVFGFGIGLTVVAAACHLAMLLLFRVYSNQFEASTPPRMFPAAPLADDREPPAPRLQIDPKADLADLRAGEDAVLNGYRWVDHSRNLVRIPIEEGMRLTLQRGLPAREASGQAAPPATAATQGRQEQGK